MNDNLIYILQTTTAEQLRAEIDKNSFVDKDLKDFNKGKEIIDNLFELNKTDVSEEVQEALIIYCMYKLKGGK